MDRNEYADLLEKIKLGACDSYLDGIILTLGERKRAIQPQAWEFSVGDRVKVSSTARPAYLRGAEATVKKVNRTRVVIDFTIPQGKFHRNVTTPPSILERV